VNTQNGERSYNPATPNVSRPTLPGINEAGMLVAMDQDMQNHQHVLSMAKAQAKQQLGDDYCEPDGDDVGINWNSPTTVNYGSQKSGMSGLAKLAVGAALLGGGLGLGSAIPWLTGKLSAGSAAPVVAPATDTDTQYQLGLGEPDAN